MESSFECEVCMVIYNSNEHRPRFLPCGHTMCSSCIENTLRICNGKLTCPFCRTRCGTGVKTLDDFPTAFALLNLLEKTEPNMSTDALSPRDKENKEYLEKKQAEYDRSMSCISNCNEHLLKLIQAKELQETIIESIEIEQNKLEEDKKKSCAARDELVVIGEEGNDIVKNLEAFQDRVKCSSNLSGLNEAAQDGIIYYTASKYWIASRAKSVIKENTHSTVEAGVSDHGHSLPQKTTANTSTTTTTLESTTAVPQGTTTTVGITSRRRASQRNRRNPNGPVEVEQQGSQHLSQPPAQCQQQ